MGERVRFFLTTRAGMLTLPMNPGEIEFPRESDNETVKTLAGEMVYPGLPKLREVTIESQFWADRMDVPPAAAHDFLTRWQESQEEGRLTVVGLAYPVDMYVVVKSYTSASKHGEVRDIHYTLELTESPETGAAVVTGAAGNTGGGGETVALAGLTVGMIVQFLGGSHWTASTDANPIGGNRTAGRATVTQKVASASHPVHLIGTGGGGGSNVYGWVNLSQIRTAAVASVPGSGAETARTG